MIRNLALLLTAAALALSGCKKAPQIHLPNKKADEAAAPAKPAVEAPEKPDLALPAAKTAGGDHAAPAPAPMAPAVNHAANVIALCYHNVEDSKTKAMTISVSEFENELKAIQSNGFTVIPMQDFLAWRRGEKNIPTKSCIITIDDGWLSAYTNAWPLLKQYKFPFTLFIYVNYVGSGGKSLSWDQLAEMRDDGVDIQSHTYSHSNLKAPGTGVDAKTKARVKKEIETLGMDGWMRKEIIGSKEALERQLGIKVNALAYPFGNYNAKARELVKEAGYEAAFTVYGQRLSSHGPSDILGRYAVEASNPKIFQDAMAMIGGGGGSEAGGLPEPQSASTSMVTEPMNDSTITNPTPAIRANLSTMGELQAGTVEVFVSGVGKLPNAKFDAATKMLTAQVVQKLKAGAYTVIVSGKVDGQKREIRWGFKFDPKGVPTGAVAPPPGAPMPPANVLGR